MKHLWEANHPYRMNEGCYHEAGAHTDYQNWDTFLSEWGKGTDLGYNRIHRFDAHINNPDAGHDVPDKYFIIYIYRIAQRKAFTNSQSVLVHQDREQEVIDYLRPYFEQEVAIWSPFTDKE